MFQRYPYFGQGFFDALTEYANDPSVNVGIKLSSLTDILISGLSGASVFTTESSSRFAVTFHFSAIIRDIQASQFTGLSLIAFMLQHRIAMNNCVNHFTLREFVASYSPQIQRLSDYWRPDYATTSSDNFASWWSYIKQRFQDNRFNFREPDLLSVGQDLAHFDDATLGSLPPSTGRVIRPQAIRLTADRIALKMCELIGPNERTVPRMLQKFISPDYWVTALLYPRTRAQTHAPTALRAHHLPPLSALLPMLLRCGQALPDTVDWCIDSNEALDRVKHPCYDSTFVIFAINREQQLILVKIPGGDLAFQAFFTDVHDGDTLPLGELKAERYLQWDIDLDALIGHIQAS